LIFGTLIPAILAVAAGLWWLRWSGDFNLPKIPVPAWPLRAGDVLRLPPGNANIAKWAQNPLSTGFVVRQIQSFGHPLNGVRTCAFEPDYMADAQQPGGKITVLSRQPGPGGDWQVRWQGGDTTPPFLKRRGSFAANCGKDAVVLMSPAQLHSLRDILAGVADSAPASGPAPASNFAPSSPPAR
jgi:hypothetical protein